MRSISSGGRRRGRRSCGFILKGAHIPGSWLRLFIFVCLLHALLIGRIFLSEKVAPRELRFYIPAKALLALADNVVSEKPCSNIGLREAGFCRDDSPCGDPVGSPSRRQPRCEKWCSTSPFAPHAISIAPRNCWQRSAETESESTRRILLFTGINGLSDSLAGAVSAFYIAVLSGAEFRMRFSRDSRDPSFLWAYEPNCVDTLNDPEAWHAVDTTPIPAVALHYKFEVYDVPEHLLATVTHGSRLPDLWKGRRVLSIETHAGFVHLLLKNPTYGPVLKKLGITSSNAFALAYNFLLRPRDAGLARFTEEISLLSGSQGHSPIIGIHIRTGVHYDGAFAPDALPAMTEQFSQFFSCAAEIESQLWWSLRPHISIYSKIPPAGPLWYILSDSVSLREDALRRFPTKVLTRSSHISVAHSRTSTLTTAFKANVTCESFLDASMEHWLFGLTDASVVTQWSGYGRTGALVHERGEERRPLFRDEGRPIFQINAFDPGRTSCALRHASTFASILEHKPGI